MSSRCSARYPCLVCVPTVLTKMLFNRWKESNHRPTHQLCWSISLAVEVWEVNSWTPEKQKKFYINITCNNWNHSIEFTNDSLELLVYTIRIAVTVPGLKYFVLRNENACLLENIHLNRRQLLNSVTGTCRSFR